MRIVLNHPGPNWSVADVYRGWSRGLRAAGAEIVEYGFHDRLWFFQNAQIERDGQLVHAAPFDLATRLALEGLGAAIYEAEPDAVMFVSGFWIRGETLDLIRRRGQRVILLCTESPYQDAEQIALAAHADVVIINDPVNIDRFREACPNTIYLPHSYDPAVHYPGPSECRSDLVFIGTGYPSRVDYLAAMPLERWDVALLGNWTAAAGTSLANYVRHDDLDGCIDNDAAANWYRGTRCGLNLYRREHADDDAADGWAMGPREIELAACGAFYCTEERPENRAVLPMIPTVSGPAEAAEVVSWAIAHPSSADRIARQARATVADWTFENRARQLLRILDP